MTAAQTEYLILNVDKSDFRYDLPINAPIVLNRGENPEIGLHSLFLFYTYPNISPTYDNDKVRVFDGAQWLDVTIPIGMYEVVKISELLNRAVQGLRKGDEVRNVKIRLNIDESTFHCSVKLAENIKIDFSQGNLHKLLGLEPKVYENYEIEEEGPGLMNITRGLDRIMIRCSLVSRYHQPEFGDVLYDVLPHADPGGAIQEKIDNIEFLHCRDRVIRSIHIRITDRYNNEVQLLEPLSLKIVFRS